MEITSQYIAPWAIANEQFPLHLIWNPDTNFDTIHITLPVELIVKEVLNVQNFDLKDSKIIINATDLFSPDYFSIILKSNEIFDELKKDLPVKIVFYKGIKELEIKTLTATIVRPRIEIIDPPKEITLKNDTDFKKLLNFKVIHSGLGKVRVDFIAKAQGKIISQSDSLYFQVLEEIATDMDNGKLEEDSTVEDVTKFEISLDPIELQESATKILERIEKGNFPDTVRKEIFQHLSEGIKDKEFRERIVRIIYSKLQRYFLSYILYYFDRNPHEDVDLPVGKIRLNLDTWMNCINLEIKYTDSYNNCYEPVIAKVDIKDNRAEKKFTQIPINIDWKGSPLILERQAN